MNESLILDKGFSACSIGPLLKNVVGIPSNSSSPTDTWVVIFKDNVKVNMLQYDKNRKRYDVIDLHAYNGFLKISVTIDTLARINYVHPNEFYNQTLHGLIYEEKMYREITQPMIDNQVCPNFVEYYGNGASCSFKDMTDIMVRGLGVSQTEAANILARNTAYMIIGEKGRPAISDLRGKDGSKEASYLTDKTDMNLIKYNMLLTRAIDPNTTEKFESWFLRKYRGELTKEIWGGIFQVLCACYALSLSQAEHNDLHSNNIYVVHLKDPVETTYVYNGKMYTITSQVKIKLYDYDRSYAKSLGENQLLNHFCGFAGQCNVVIPNVDIVKFFCHMYRMVNAEDKTMILKLLAPAEFVEDLEKLYNREFCNAILGNTETTARIFSKFTAIDDLLDLIGKDILGATDIPPTKDLDSIFVCGPEMFDADGRLTFRLDKNELLQSAMD